jgi:rubrerythrin
MIDEKLKEIISFAIQREQEAVKFYQDLMTNVQFSERKNLLHEFEMMERSHIRVLEKLQTQIEKESIGGIEINDVENLHISDYIVEPSQNAELRYQDVLIIGMKREQASFTLYTDLAERSSDDDVKRLFLRLASEEAKHKLFFERIYDEEILTQD